jgi:hypothetical protein
VQLGGDLTCLSMLAVIGQRLPETLHHFREAGAVKGLVGILVAVGDGEWLRPVSCVSILIVPLVPRLIIKDIVVREVTVERQIIGVFGVQNAETPARHLELFLHPRCKNFHQFLP